MREDYAGLYRDLHENTKTFVGRSIRTYVPQIVDLVKRCEPRRLLDYGCGKGYQYLALRVHEEWGGMLPYCYDVGVRQLSERPAHKFDGIICTDMMEHIAECDVDEVLQDIFSFVYGPDVGYESFVFFAICCRPSGKTLPDGRDVHLTVQPPEWWDAKIAQFKREDLIIEGRYDLGKGYPQIPMFAGAA